MTTALIIAHDHLIRALYSAKESLKNASAIHSAAEQKVFSANASTDAAERCRLGREEAEAYAAYVKVEKTYESCHHACKRLGLLD